MTATYPGFTATAALAPRGHYGGTFAGGGPATDAIVAAKGCDTACCANCEICRSNPSNSAACRYCNWNCGRPGLEEGGSSEDMPVFLTR